VAKQAQILPNSLQTTFISLRNSNFRIYFVAQIVSSIGTWIQITAENWLILRLTDSGLALGITNALQFGPLVFFGLYGGVIADRFNRRRLLIVTQSTQAVLAAVIGSLVVTNLIEVWMIWSVALLLGLIMSVDKPALLGFLKEPRRGSRLAQCGRLEQCRHFVGTDDRPGDQWSVDRVLRHGSQLFHQCRQFRACRGRSGNA